MDEYIERKAALRPFIIDKNGNRIHEVDIDNWKVEIPIKQVKQILREVPAADVVEVCRCRDCMYWQSGENDAEKWEWCIFHKHSLGPHGFCNYGERRSE